ncbi:hypothetical protein [Clostridium sp. BNL1100]|uniref:hypothetical protein n=1 Tax=Clostridium sp. BNL1100 TaxID=755731 RepID=UPI00059F6662|nr:hypothetical protein [Clostridium sp. BNL1100]
MKIKCVIDNKLFTSKPSGFEVGKIVNRMSIETASEYSIDEIKESILQGKTIRPSYCGGKEDSWKSQQMFMIDIDNKPSRPKGMSESDYQVLCKEYLINKHRTYDDIIDYCKQINLIPTLIYTSFSHKDNWHKMRLVFILDKPIDDFITAKKIQLYIMNTIGEVDEQCKNLNRFYYAGNNIVFDSGNIIDSDFLINMSKDIEINNYTTNKVSKKVGNKEVQEKGTNILNEYNNLSNILVPLSKNTTEYYNIKALRERNADYLKEKINNNPIEFNNVSEFWYYIYHNINMVELLELKYPKSIKCLFHQDNSPSASVFKNDEGVWLYKCFSDNCGLTMNVKQLIEKLGNFKSEYKAIEFIKNIYNLSIKESSWSIEQKANLDSILYKLDMNIFAELCPVADKNIRYVKDLFCTLVHIAKDNIYGDNYMNSDGDAVFFISLSELAKITKTYANNLNKLSQRIAVLVYHDLVRKLDDDKIPEVMLKKAQALSIDKGTDKRINFYSIPSWVFEQLNIVEQQGIKWKNNGYTVKGASYEMFYRGEGLEVAQHIYPQHKKVATEFINIDTGEIITKITDRTTSKKSTERVDKITSCIQVLIKDKRYTTEKELIMYLSKEYRWEVTEIQLRKMRGQLEKLGFKRIRVNKEIKEQLGISTDGYPFIIMRVD